MTGASRSERPVESGPSTLLDLHREGRLVREYPGVRRLLCGASDAELARAGQLLARLDPDEVVAEHPAVPVVSVAVTGHGTLAPLLPSLTVELARHGLLLRPHLADFDAYVFDLADPGGELYRADLALCVLDPMVVFDEVPVPWGPEDVERVARERIGTLAGLVARFAESARGTLVLNTLPLPRRFAAQLVDHRSRARLGAVWREANARLLRLAEEHERVVVLDLDPLAGEGVPVVEPRLSQYTRTHLSPALLSAYAREIGHLARHRAGQGKKALVLDLDGTLWGGILGEDGPDGIEIGADGTHRGGAHHAFQRVVGQLAAQGVLLAAVSKNDPEPVGEVLRGHPGMFLREDDFVRVVANWRPKHDNLTELANALNLGVDSFVFVDDSPYECGLVRHELPGVSVVPVNGEPALHIEALLRDGWFDTPELTREDVTRVAQYRDELVRKDFLDGFDSLDEYLRQLRVEVHLVEAGPAEVARLSQLTLRTNQFNQTTLRLGPAEVRALLDDPAVRVLAVRAADRFGDSGVVGAVFTRRHGDTVHIDNFLLSCRVFSRGIEQTALCAVLRHARAHGARTVRANYRATPKNTKVKDFYPRNGFVRVADENTTLTHTTLTRPTAVCRSDGTTVTYEHGLTVLPVPPAHVHFTEIPGDDGS
ncbi:HAD-IIIC family phosphatase [Streptomyces phaeochromogenes]|uniref:HAD-IIIC family phosphatase n=1 Tax=Streptomyces phaeochromogenes TaxID=1923 RepID=A0ABZ1H4I1_STRPH|nr:HAD-IIIC family phosphatase [Streptomyces phaeochromogenes]WSD13471.1 HAD-IIIC family phosphatase [Streptomyces phaeochromogenes]